MSADLNWLNFRHLYAFWMVSKTQSFTLAARKMNVAQSAISSQISQLESYLEESLFMRSTRKLALTKAGRKLQSYAEVIFEASKDINLTLKDNQSSHWDNQLSIGVVGGVSRNYLYRLLKPFLKKHPKMNVSVITGSIEELGSLIRSLDLDVIITTEAAGRKDLANFTYKKIGHSTMCLAGQQQIIREIKAKKSMENLDLYAYRHPYDTEIAELLVGPLFKGKATVKMNTDDIPLLRFFANSGDGVAIIPKIGIMEDIKSGRMEYIPLLEAADLNVYGVYMKKMVREGVVENLLQPVD